MISVYVPLSFLALGYLILIWRLVSLTDRMAFRLNDRVEILERVAHDHDDEHADPDGGDDGDDDGEPVPELENPTPVTLRVVDGKKAA